MLCGYFSSPLKSMKCEIEKKNRHNLPSSLVLVRVLDYWDDVSESQVLKADNNAVYYPSAIRYCISLAKANQFVGSVRTADTLHLCGQDQN